MKNTSKRLNVLFFIGLAFLTFTSYSQKEKDVNKQVIENLYDQIAQKSFGVLLNDNDRVTLDDFKTENLKLIEIKKSLDSLNPKLMGVANAAKYAVDLIKEKENLLKRASLFEEKDSFDSALDSIISSGKTYNKNIIGNNTSKENYINLDKEVKKSIAEAKSKFSEPPKETPIPGFAPGITTPFSKDPKRENQFSNLWFYIIVGLLFLSILYNILQVRKISKLRKAIATNKRIEKIENNEAYQPKVISTPKFSSAKSKVIFENLFNSMLSGLNSEYSVSCVETANVQAYKNPMLEELETKSFATETEAKSFVEQQIQRAKARLVDKIDDCRDRHTAEGIVDNELESSQFRNSKLDGEEKRAIILRITTNLKNSLSETIDAKELERKIDTARETIKQDIINAIRKNSEYYISFFDTDGTIADSKKSKIRKRDSVVKFFIDTDDPSRATYTLLYDDAIMMKSGIQSYQGLLLPICKIEGAVDPNGNSIVQIGEDGTVNLSNGYWKVDEKLTIKII